MHRTLAQRNYALSLLQLLDFNWNYQKQVENALIIAFLS